MSSFVHLTTRSSYSLMRGTATPEQLVEAAVARGHAAVGLCDWRGLYGAVAFERAARTAGVRPLIGASLPTGPSSGTLLTALARDNRGYGSLCRLVTADQMARPKHMGADADKWQEPVEARPILELALENAVGLLFLTDDAETLQRLAAALGAGAVRAERIVPTSATERNRQRTLREQSRQLGVRGVASARAHCLAPDDFDLQRVMAAIREGSTVDRLDTRELARPVEFFADAVQMERWFGDEPELLAETLAVAEECEVRFPGAALRMPRFVPPDGTAPESMLRRLCETAIPDFYPPRQHRAAQVRLDHELEIICSMGYAAYFLVVWDMVQFARQRRIPLTGRGSAADSLVSYLLGFTHVDPIRHRLYFERFLNRARTSPPDVDLDLCWRRRDDVVDYVYQRWGSEHVAMLSTHVTLAGRSCVREVGKALGFSESELNPITRMLPHYGTLADLDTLQRERAESRKLDPDGEPLRSVLPLARRISGFPWHLGVHPSGIVVAPERLTDWVPLERAAKGLTVTQYDMYPVEDLGFLKIDLLGQRSLSVIADVEEQLRAGGQPDFEIEKVDCEADRDTQNLIASARTMGVFQIESPGIRGVLKKVQARDFETVTAASSVIRPGPKDAGALRTWIRRHTGHEPTRYLHPRLAEVLGETHGIMIYQEDVLRMAQVVAGMTMAQADQMRRSMSGKRPDKPLRAMGRDFIDGAVRNGIDPNTAKLLWDQMQAFAGYAFCKAHSASYTVLSFRSAWLKTHYPAEFMGAVLANGGGFYHRAAYVSEARRLGLRILGPCINQSLPQWLGADDTVRCGLEQIKGLRREAMDRIMAGREQDGLYASIWDALRRLKALEQSDWERLGCAGALDDLRRAEGPRNRPEIMWIIDQWFGPAGGGGPHARQLDIVDEENGGVIDAIPVLPDYSEARKFDQEAGLLDVAIRSHPLDRFRSLLPDPRSEGLLAASRMAKFARRRVKMIGWLVTSRRLRTSRGSYMKFLSLEDKTDIYEAILFDKAYQQYGHLTRSGGPYLVEGRIEEDEGHCTLNIDKLELLGREHQERGRDGRG